MLLKKQLTLHEDDQMEKFYHVLHIISSILHIAFHVLVILS